MRGRKNRTTEKDEKFFAAIAAGKTVTDAAKAARYPNRSVYEYRDADEEFGRRWKEADEVAIQRMEKEADRRAITGTLKPVFHQGVECGQIREFSDTLLIFRLKAKRPEVYRERLDNHHSGAIDTSGVLVVPGTATEEEWQRLQEARKVEKPGGP